MYIHMFIYRRLVWTSGSLLVLRLLYYVTYVLGLSSWQRVQVIVGAGTAAGATESEAGWQLGVSKNQGPCMYIYIVYGLKIFKADGIWHLVHGIRHLPKIRGLTTEPILFHCHPTNGSPSSRNGHLVLSDSRPFWVLLVAR